MLWDWDWAEGRLWKTIKDTVSKSLQGLELHVRNLKGLKDSINEGLRESERTLLKIERILVI